MADPTDLKAFAIAESDDLKTALTAANAELTAARQARAAADDALKRANANLSAANTHLADVRRRLGLIPMPADGEPLLDELRDAIADQRDKAAAQTLAAIEAARAAARLAAASARVPGLTTRLRAAEAAVEAAEKSAVRRAEAIAAADDPPVSDIDERASDALASQHHTDAQARIDGALPAALRDRAMARQEAASASVARVEQLAEAARAAYEAAAGATAADRLPRLRRADARAAAALFAFVEEGPQRLAAAVAILETLAGSNTPALTAEQKDAIDADAAARTAAATAEATRDAAAEKVAAAFVTLETERMKLLASEPEADLAAAEADAGTPVGQAKADWETAKTDLATEEAAFTAAMRTAMREWRAAVPDTLWSEAEAFFDADRKLTELSTASAAPLIADLQTAAAALLATLIVAAERAGRLEDAAARVPERGAAAMAATAQLAALRAAGVRGHFAATL